MLRRLACGDCTPTELIRCEEHVNSCSQCAELLESRAVDDDWRRNLSPAFQSRAAHDDCTEALPPRDSAAIEASLKLLGPTDDPHMLGRIGSYEVIGLIGGGGMGVVFKAFDAALNRFVAIKMMQPHLAVSGAARQRFEREGRAAAAVINDCVLPIHAVAEWQGVPYLVMQYSPGMNLQRRLETQGPLRLPEILRVALQTSRGLAAAHSQGLVHRDVKPSNILLDGSVERTLLTDFGLARAVDDASVTRTGLIAGTPQYMSPEQSNAEPIDQRSDLFSLGSVLYTLSTGRPPFRSQTSYGLIREINEGTPTPILELNPAIPEWLCAVIGKLMAKKKFDRFQSAQEVQELLEACLGHVQQPTVNQLPPIPGISTHPIKTSFLKSSMGVLCMVSLFSILAIAGFMMSSVDSVTDKLAGMKGIDGYFHEMTDDDVRVVVYSVSAEALGTDRPAAVCDFGTGRIALLNQDVKYPRTYHSHKVKISGEQPKDGRSLFLDKSNAFRFVYKNGVADCEFIDFKFQYQDGQIHIGDHSYAFHAQESPGPLLIVDRDSGAVTMSSLKPESERVHLTGKDARTSAQESSKNQQMSREHRDPVHEHDTETTHTFEIADSGKKIGQRTVVVKPLPGLVAIRDSVDVNVEAPGIDFEGGQFSEALYSTKMAVPSLSDLEVRCIEDGEPFISGSVRFKNGKATMEWSTSRENGRSLDSPTQHSLTVDILDDPVVLPSTIQTIGPMLLPNEGKCVITWAEIDKKATARLIKIQKGCTLQRTDLATGGFELVVKNPGVDVALMTLQYNKNNLCVRAVLEETTIMTLLLTVRGSLPAYKVPHEHPESIRTTVPTEPVAQNQAVAERESFSVSESLHFERHCELLVAYHTRYEAIVKSIHDEATSTAAANDFAELLPLIGESGYLGRMLRRYQPGPEQKALHSETEQKVKAINENIVAATLKIRDKPYFDIFGRQFMEVQNVSRSMEPFSINKGHAQHANGPQFVVWMPAGASGEIDLSDEMGRLEVLVVNQTTGELSRQREHVECGGRVGLPSSGSKLGTLCWLRPIVEPIKDETVVNDSQPLTWKDVFGSDAPENYPTDALSLIGALNNSRGKWVFSGRTNRDDSESEFEASMEIRGGVREFLRQDSFPQWIITIDLPRESPTDRFLFNIMALPEPTGIKWMVAPYYVANDGKPVSGKCPMYEGAWNAETATIVWTSKQMRSPLQKDTPAKGPASPQSTFQMELKPNGEIRINDYQHNDSFRFSGQSAARVGEPFVEKGPAIEKLPGGYRIFFASRLEVYLEAPGQFEGAGPRIDKIGCEDKYIFGLIATYPHNPESSDTPGYFWIDSESGKITKGLELTAWREALEAKGVDEPRLFGPEDVGE
ncbi:MAG: serine/threonine protein kinase [Planctomycetales bacterium]|nr:serine/threonine protein kinase [Planctomycetales bacterium]